MATPETGHNIFVKPRRDLIAWVRKQLVGPPDADADGNRIVLALPTERFPVGALYPVTSAGEGIDPATEDEYQEDALADSAGVTGENKDEPAVIRRYIPPSSLGFSFFVTGAQIRLQVLYSAFAYAKQDAGRWERVQLIEDGSDQEAVINFTSPSDKLPSTHKYPIFGGRAAIDVKWRPLASGWILTLSLCNTQEIDSGEIKSASAFVSERAARTLFEASLRCVVDEGEVGAYPRVDRSLLDEEEQEIELQYGKRQVYAIGHGCAAEWKICDGKVSELYSDTMPTVEVPQMTADTGAANDPALMLARLAELSLTPAPVLDELTIFVNAYASWVAGQRGSIAQQVPDDQAAAARIIDRMDLAVSRMHEGLRLLKNDEQARLAFVLANTAMLDQMQQHDRLQGRHRQRQAYCWRPFQLAFLLTTLESTANPDSDFRDLLDLIWFPTGGGKTEAYLGLIAFLIVLRRLRHPDRGGGTAVLMRYTLRLLTRDQFIRATRLICALELLRRQQPDELGTEEISIGMWVGEDSSPNRFDKAAEQVANAAADRSIPGLVLDACPWCGEPFTARRNYDSSAQHFHFRCTNKNCDFGAKHRGKLPCNVVDEALYDAPPTMLVATVDKFARLAWEERASAFFGGEAHLPPELIIQDELHLIAGALGSVAGLYEAAIDTVTRLRGSYPKYIASTATIRMASQQVRQLYGRDVAVFPPPGIDCDDSYFARTVALSTRPGRIYVGYLAPMLNRQRCMAPLAASLLLAPRELFATQQDGEALLDAWWTQMVYHGSLRGVGNSHTAYVSEVLDFMALLAVSPSAGERRRPRIAQLTSLQTAEQNAAIFARLHARQDEEGCLDAVLATNMISVGLDVGRLGLMVVNGQPLTTAEYIQASSRVGRAEVPGLVFANYYRDQARSLSHYESFRPYHEAFYRFVEPGSVTPYTYQARLRALHAALVIVIRHGVRHMLDNDRAGDFDADATAIANAITRLKVRFRQAAPQASAAVDAHLDQLVRQWQDEVGRCQQSRRKLEYQVPDRETGRDRLLYNHSDRIRGLWPTLQSLRNVEDQALLKV
ncbi:MAG: helicase-related protein [Thauera sp.]|jgi:hypothetical protein|nr:helicase-related protein [Thauera sp.]